jgi:hypothetical protein
MTRTARRNATVAKLRAEVAQLRAENVRQQKALDVCCVVHEHNVKLKARLTAQPATAPIDCGCMAGLKPNGECSLGGVTTSTATNERKTRTEDEQRVLDAMGLIREEALRRLRKDSGGSVADAIDAELARRGLKP